MATTYLTRTPGSASNRQTWTVSIWFKRGNISGSNLPLLTADGAGDIETFIRFRDTNLLQISTWNGSGYDFDLRTNRLFRDTSAWYHVVVAADTTQGTASNRIKLYVNGVQETSFSTETYPSVDYNTYINTTVPQIIGSNGGSSYFDGSMAMMQLVDGQQLTPAYFGSTDSTTGIWTPTATSSISDYGTNGFKLAMDTTTPGADTSGKSNTFTASGTPTLTQGSPDNNWCTMNPIVYSGTSGQPVFSNGNTTVSATGIGGWHPAFGSIGVTSGKWYFETKVIGYNHCVVGIANETGTYNTVTSGFPPSQPYSYGIVCYDLGKKETNNSRTVYGSQTNITDGQIIGTAIDLDNNKLYWSVNGVFKNSGDPTSGSTGTGSAFSLQAGETYFPMVVGNIGGGSNPAGGNLNFGEGFFGTTAAGINADDNGQGLFAYDVPAGYYALNTKNLEAYG